MPQTFCHAQDAVCAYRRFGGDPEQLFFGVFDGHGQLGTSCAQFAKDKVPANLLANPGFASNPVEAFRGAMTQCNQQLHISSIDDSMSGTTAIACLVRGRTLHVANVGDSRWAKHRIVLLKQAAWVSVADAFECDGHVVMHRAVLAERVDGKIVARPLSCDHTPFRHEPPFHTTVYARPHLPSPAEPGCMGCREDECERVKEYGARIMTLDQLEGVKVHALHPAHEGFNDLCNADCFTNLPLPQDPNVQCWGTEQEDDGDPPRLWAPNAMYPGTAFTRSLGDTGVLMAKDLDLDAGPAVCLVSAADRWLPC